MTAFLRLLVSMARPPLVVLLGLFAATGLAQAGHPDSGALLARVLLVTIAFLLFNVVINDLSDRAIDRVNLPGDPSRPQAHGLGTDRDFAIVGATSGVLALGASLLLGGPALAVVAAGMALGACYSLRPIRLADRGALASLLLPAGYVAVPYLVGLFAVRRSVRPDDLYLLAGLYIGFIGRILLKDFRDVRGDTLFGKRTFLVRHGRRATCAASAVCWTAGSFTLFAVRDITPAFVCLWVAYVGVALGVLWALASDRGPRRDETLISSVALIGRGMIVTLIAHFAMMGARLAAPAYDGLLLATGALVLGTTARMLRHGPSTRLTVPSDLTARAPTSASPSPMAAPCGRA